MPRSARRRRPPRTPPPAATSASPRRTAGRPSPTAAPPPCCAAPTIAAWWSSTAAPRCAARSTLAPRLERALAKQLPGLRPAGTRRVALGGTQGLISTFVRPAAGQVQSVVVAPAGDRAYTLDL